MDKAYYTSSAHTPAPWTLEDESDEDDVRLELKGDSGSKPIAHLYSCFHSPLREYESEEEELADYAEYAANACLIAAAPELLRKCTEYSGDCATRIEVIQDEEGAYCECENKDNHKRHCDAGEQIRHWQATKDMVDAVIRQAEGQTG